MVDKFLQYNTVFEHCLCQHHQHYHHLHRRHHHCYRFRIKGGIRNRIVFCGYVIEARAGRCSSTSGRYAWPDRLSLAVQYKWQKEGYIQCCDLESRDHGLETWVHSSSFLSRSRSRSRDLMAKISVLVSRPEDPGLGLGLKTACLVPTPVARLP